MSDKHLRQALANNDDRFGSAGFLRRNLNKVFPDHWSFMLGEIALYSFVILLLTGTFLTLFFKPSVSEVIYNGSYVPLKGLPVTEAYNSTLHISFEVRGGLIIRQIHHWAALLFVSSIVAHLCRIFFTGAFRKPREVNWLIGVGLLTLALGEGFTGYSLPDDLLSTTGLRIAYGVAESIPLVGTYVSFFLFGGEFPGPDIIPRLYVIHILLIPGILLALITAHMLIMWHQKHTQWAGKHRTNENVVGSPFYPNFMAKTGGFFFMVFAVLALLGGLVQINPVWLWGPYNPAQISAGSQPDWYIGFLEGSLRIMPNLETNILGHTISWNILIPGVIIPGAMFTALAIYPFLEAWVTGDRREHHLCDRPRNRPGRTGIGVMALTFYGILLAAGGNDLIADKFDIQLFATTWFFRGAIIVLPPIAFWVTRRICLGLQRRDMHTAAHGFETGRIIRLPSGEYIEVEAPLSEERLLSLDIANQSTPPPALPPATDARGVPNPSQRGPLNRFRRSMMGILYESRDGEVEHEPEEQPKSITRE